MTELRTRPHDLLRLSGGSPLPADVPDWAAQELRRTPWVVVRRAAAPHGLIPTGVRGVNRAQRYGTCSRPDEVHAVVTPESLARSNSTRSVRAAHTLCLARPLLDATGLAWGPTGSIGFELATGRPTATPDSDLDLLIRAGDLRDALPLLTPLHHQLRALPARVDCLVETASGALALAELADGRKDLLLRTPGGPRLVARSRLS